METSTLLVPLPRVRVIAGLVAAVSLGCAPPLPEIGPAGACRPPVADVTELGNRAAVLAWARTVAFRPAGPTEGMVYGFTGMAGAVVRLDAQVESFSPCDSLLARGCLLGRIISNRAHADLGVIADTNYLFVDRVSRGRWSAAIVPNNMSAPTKVHLIERHTHVAGTTRSAPAAGYGVCRACCREWCVSPRDSL